MITKDEYLLWRSRKYFNTKIYYSFYMDNKDEEWENISFENFSSKFKEFVDRYNMKVIGGTNGNPVKINYNNIIKKCIEYFDRKFNVNL